MKTPQRIKLPGLWIQENIIEGVLHFIYYYRYQQEGKRKRVPVGSTFAGDTNRIIRARYNQVKAQVDAVKYGLAVSLHGQNLIEPVATPEPVQSIFAGIGEYIEKFKTWCKATDKNGKQHKSARFVSDFFHLTKFGEYFGNDHNLESITDRDLNQFYQFRSDEGDSASSLKNRQKHINPFFKWLYNQQYISNNPTLNVDKDIFNGERRVFQQYFTLDQTHELIANAPTDQDRILWTILGFTGFAPVDGGTLTPECIQDVEYEGETKRCILKPRTKSSVHAIVPVLDLLAGLNDDELFSASVNKSTRTNSGKRLAETAKKLGIKLVSDKHRISLYSFRYTIAQLLFETGTEPGTIQKILGHSNIKTQDFYITANAKGVYAALDKSIKAISEVTPN